MELDLDFIATIEDADIQGINEYLGVSKDFDIETRPIVHIKYGLEPEARNWGLKGISIVPTNITAIITWEIDALEMTQENIDALVKAGGKEYGRGYNYRIEGTIEFETLCLGDWKIDNEIEFKPDGGVSINDVRIDLTKRTITMS